MTMNERFTSFDPAAYLRDRESAAAYLEATLAGSHGDASAVAHALGVVARSGNLSELARRTGLTREGLYKSLSLDGNPSFATIMAVVRELGLTVRFAPVEEVSP